MTVLVTGAAGFIGFHLTTRLLKEKIPVIGLDNFNSYYDPNLKRARILEIQQTSEKTGASFALVEGNLEDAKVVNSAFRTYNPEIVVNLAAQAGVRYSIENPSAYIDSNIVGFTNILEGCRHTNVKHLVYASSSSVYGGNSRLPLSESHGVDHPISLYAASKKANELMAHTYSHLYGISTTGLRFFTVYGPWGRPDMALFLFTKAILNKTPIQVFNNGQMTRDFTYIDDIIESIFRIMKKPPMPNKSFNTNDPSPDKSWAPYRIFNVGNSSPTSLMDYIAAIEYALDIRAVKEFLPMQSGDVPNTAADTSELESWIDFRPGTSINQGIGKFVSWYRDFYKV